MTFTTVCLSVFLLVLVLLLYVCHVRALDCIYDVCVRVSVREVIHFREAIEQQQH